METAVRRQDALAAYLASDPVEANRWETLCRDAWRWEPWIRGRDVLDFGAGSGLSMLALAQLGAARVVGVEPDRARVLRGQAIVRGDPRLRLQWVPDTRRLPFRDGIFSSVVANAVLEHIPRPRAAYLCELWRVLAPGGHLIVHETPNQYLPWDFHTTDLPLVNWLPSRLAERIARGAGRYRFSCAWEVSGWRGIGYREIARCLPGHELVPDLSRRRHRVLHRLGLPPGLFDPYPLWVFRRET